MNEGTWRVDGASLILRDEVVNGVKVQPALRLDRVWTLRPNGEIISGGRYSAYNVEEYYTRQ